MMDKTYKDYKNYNPPSAGGYKSFPFFQQAEIVYDFTVEFCQKYIEYKSRTKDQMIQAARSGKHPKVERSSLRGSPVPSYALVLGQNIAEGYLQKSLEGRLKLLGVARGSLEELLNDYQDFLRQKKLAIWAKDSPGAKAVRSLVYNDYKNYKGYKIYISSPEKAANAMICLINQTNQLLDQKLRWVEEKFVKEGGFRENLFKKRAEFRRNL